MPSLHILGKTGIQHITHDVVTMMADDGLGFLAEQWWNHLDAMHRLILIVTDGERQLGCGSHAGDAGKELQQCF